ncbi:cation/multidrug efflux pump [Zhongshania aquimaris]|uniref:Cation/multidrug efflux pump n=1 Tax=Zhongshania aquimaris TaxID=2857107 RepID=A0ABS6VLF2_9GAMM|nr:cation/multidrug efflux pump [Zhongshania aquimaris]MBW2939152.1 cation/multidrug efflux pump [Zhongshania aquimaris]
MDTFVGLDQALLIICSVGVLLCFLAFIRLRRHVFTGLVAVLLSLSFTGAALVITKDVYSYRHLADEQLVARIFVAGKAKQQYIVSVDTVNDDPLQTFLIMGDQWQLDSRVIRWNFPIARLGFDNLYRLERVSGRYQSIEEERNMARTIYLISLSEPVDIWAWLHSNSYLIKWVEADYGNAVFAPMVDGAQFNVYLGRDGLFIRAGNPIAVKALGNWPT